MRSVKRFAGPSAWNVKPKKRERFYAVLAIASTLGLALNFTKINPIHALVWSAIVNGITGVPVMCFMMLMASNPKVMGKLKLPLQLRILGWAATCIMGAAAFGMFLTAGK
jgi:Mn2+/Fe2+ NRAMP family transporter